MPRWRELPQELDPQVREFASQLRRLVDRSGLSIAAVADRTGYSKTSWERYLNGRLLAPKGAIVALAEVTGTNPIHLTTMWELAERAWSRSEMRHDMTMEAIRISQARAALGEFGPTSVKSKNGRTAQQGAAVGTAGAVAGVAGPAGVAPSVPPQPSAPDVEGVAAGDGLGSVVAPPGRPGGPAGTGSGPGGSPDRQRRGRRLTMFLAGVVGALIVIAAAVLLTNPGDDSKGGNEAKAPSATPTTSNANLPEGVQCSGKDCTGKDPEIMGCGGELARTTTSVTVGTALVEVRYSKTCGAAWARITQATAGDKVQITSGSAKQNGTVDDDADAYTPMVAVKDATDAAACATLKAGQKGCTE
ncbi:XRE family transcriptional regulator [Streptomyces sp. NPDC002896]|uniref:XRE family transcriptional regulator n=1 Tax=Streptomyces sp. NPDC002896 TaxID=3154438 RepID=UPI00331B06F6